MGMVLFVFFMIFIVVIACCIPIILIYLYSSGWFSLDESLKQTEQHQNSSELIHKFSGKMGITKSPLRPAGIATIEGIRLDVVSQGGFIPAKTEIEVVKVEGRRIVVKQV